MHIGFDARMYGPQHGGIGRYIEQLITNLLEIDRTHTYTFFVQPNQIIPHHSQRITLVETPIKWYSLAEQTTFLSLLKKNPVDLMHFPHWNVPLLYNKPFIVTIHDLILMHHPNRKASTLPLPLYKLKYAAFKKILNHAAHASQHILTVSDFSKQDIVNTLHIPSEKITTTHLGISHTKQNESEKPHDKPYMLAVGVQYPHKNLLFLMDVFSKIQKDWDLIIAGPKGPFSDDLKKQAQKINQKSKGDILCKFDQTDDQLAALYKNAQIFLFPSLYEGFGLPPLEAMQASTPVIASNASCMPEILGDAAHLADPTSQHEWIDAIHLIATNPTYKYTLTSRGHEQLKKYSWRSCASSTLESYKNRGKLL